MISQLLPCFVGATSMSRMSEDGVFKIVEGEELSALALDPLSGIYPEAIDITLAEPIPLNAFLHFLGYVCLRHKALLEVDVAAAGANTALPSAVVHIISRNEPMHGLVIIRGQSVLFLLPPQ